MEKYSAYKDSGVQWIHPIPSHWKFLRNKSFMSLTDEKVGDRKDITLLSLTKQGVIERDLSEGKGKFPKEFDSYLVVRPDDLVFCLFDVDETPRTVGLVHNYGMLTGAYTNFSINRDVVLPEFAAYYYIQIDDVKGLRPYYTGLRKVVKTNTFLQLRLPVPPLHEQQAIVSYLDDKCGKIDQLLENKAKELELLAEMKQRVIADAVTKGLNPGVEMKPTGIFWWPTAPKSWNVRRLGHILKKQYRQRPDNSELLVCTNKGKVVKRGDSKMGLVADSNDIYQGVSKGDLLIHGMDTWHGAIAVSELDGMCTPVVHVCTSSQNCEFIALYMQVMAYSKIFKLISNGVRQNTSDFRSWNKVAPIPIPLPSVEEQNAIVEHVKMKSTTIDKLCDTLRQEIENIKEYKQRLISDVVTGQIKVC